MKTKYLLGAGIKVKSLFKVDKHCSIQPAKLDSNIDILETLATTQQDYGFLCALADTITFELVISGSDEHTAVINLWNYQWFLILLSVYASTPTYWPFQCNKSTKNLNGNKIILTNLFFNNRIFAEPRMFSERELKECSKLWPNFNRLLENRNFAHAASVAMTNFNEPKISIRMAAIWSGIESLLGFDQELRFRISLAIARLLEHDAAKREKRFIAVKKLYDNRSKCVHGSTISSKDEKEALESSLALLRELLIFFTQRGSTMSPQERDLIFLE